MKKMFTVMVKTADGLMQPRGVLADDTPNPPRLPNPCPASLRAHIAALEAAGAGAEVMNLNVTNIDIDVSV